MHMMLPVYGRHVNVSNFLLHLLPFISLQNSHTIRRRNFYLQNKNEFLYVIQYEWRLSTVLDKSWDFFYIFVNKQKKIYKFI